MVHKRKRTAAERPSISQWNGNFSFGSMSSMPHDSYNTGAVHDPLASEWMKSLVSESKAEERRWARWDFVLHDIAAEASEVSTETVDLWKEPLPAWLPPHLCSEARKWLRAGVGQPWERRRPVRAERSFYVEAGNRTVLGVGLVCGKR